MKKKTIFTTITLGLVTLLGLGFLGAINSQPKEAKASEITIPQKKGRKITSDYESIIGSNKTYYACAKNGANSGSGVFYQAGDMSIGGILSNNLYFGEEPNTNPLLRLVISVEYFNGVHIENRQFAIDTYYSYTSLGHYEYTRLSSIYFINGGEIYSRRNGGIYNRNGSAFIFKNPRYAFDGTRTRYIQFLFTLFDIYELEDEYFIFDNFNPYYLWNVNYKENPYVNYSSDIGYAHNISIEPFFVGGFAFDTIRINYANANNTHFKIGDDYLTTNFSSSGNYVYFNDMGYYNSVLDKYLPILRQEVIYGTNNYEGMTINVGSLVWVSDEYKTLQFFEKPSTNTINNLMSLTNISQRAEFVTYNDVGLGNAFALISQAFTAWLPILQVSIVPGITLGLLIFLPLIAGIIIFIIWIVKR